IMECKYFFFHHNMKQAYNHTMNDCCPPPVKEASCHNPKRSLDYLFWSSLLAVPVLSVAALLQGSALHAEHDSASFATLSRHIQELVNTIWWGIVLGIVMISVLIAIPREWVMSLLGTHKGVHGIMRATAAGVFLDLCSHGILMV